MRMQRFLSELRRMHGKKRIVGAMRTKITRSIAAFVLTMLANVAAAQIFECVNAKGETEYAYYCAPGTVQQRQIGKSGESSGDSAPDAGSPPPQKSLQEQNVEFLKRQLERQEAEAKAAKDKAGAEEAERNCNEMRGQLKALEEGQRVNRVDPDTGERIFIGDEERAAQIVNARKSVEQWCKK